MYLCRFCEAKARVMREIWGQMHAFATPIGWCDEGTRRETDGKGKK